VEVFPTVRPAKVQAVPHSAPRLAALPLDFEAGSPSCARNVQGPIVWSGCSEGLVTVTVAGRNAARANQISWCCDGALPPRSRFGSKGPQRRSGDEVALKVERVVDGGMDAEEALGGSS
jgi:hypothetical protein